MYTTLGAPSGGSGRTGHSGVDVRQSRPITPVNSSCTPTVPPRHSVPASQCHDYCASATPEHRGPVRSAADGFLELVLVHLRTALDALVLRLVVELLFGATTGT